MRPSTRSASVTVGRGAAPAVAGGAGIGARALGTDDERAAGIEPRDRSTAGADGVDGQRRQPHREPRHRARSAAARAPRPCTRHTSVLVPPMSNATASGNPQASASAAAARTPPAGPDRSSRAGCAAASSSGTSPPADVITSTSPASGARPAQVGRSTPAAARRRRRRGHHPLVLAELRRHLVRAHHLVARATAARRRPRARGSGRGRRARGTPPPRRPRPTSGTTPSNGSSSRPPASRRPPTSKRSSRGTSGAGRSTCGS